MKKVLLILFIAILIIGLFFTSKYAIRYANWLTMSKGYPGLYKKSESYPFLPADSILLNADWKFLAGDSAMDGKIPNWPDAKELYAYQGVDTVWLAFSLHNNSSVRLRTF